MNPPQAFWRQPRRRGVHRQHAVVGPLQGRGPPGAHPHRPQGEQGPQGRRWPASRGARRPGLHEGGPVALPRLHGARVARADLYSPNFLYPLAPRFTARPTGPSPRTRDRGRRRLLPGGPVGAAAPLHRVLPRPARGLRGGLPHGHHHPRLRRGHDLPPPAPARRPAQGRHRHPGLAPGVPAPHQGPVRGGARAAPGREPGPDAGGLGRRHEGSPSSGGSPRPSTP